MSLVRTRAWASAALLTFAGMSVASSARADASPQAGSISVSVLGFLGDGADEQAEALSSAIRLRFKSVGGYTAVEPPQPLGLMVVGFRCPPKPDAACLEKIAKNINADRMLWGTMSRGKGTVTVEVHYYDHGKDTVAQETYSDNLKDAQDPALEKIARKILTQLLGLSTGTVQVQAADYECGVGVDGSRAGQLEKGNLTLELPPGKHTVELLGPCKKVSSTVRVVANTKSVVDLSKAPTESVPEGPSKPFPTRTVVAISAIGLGAVSGIVAGVFGAKYWSARSDIQDKVALTPGATNEYGSVVTRKDASGKDVLYFELKDLKREYMVDPNSTASDVNCSAVPSGQTGVFKLCDDRKSMNGNIAPGIIFGVLGGALITTGVVLLVTDKSSAHASASATARDTTTKDRQGAGHVAVVPWFTPGSQGVSGLSVMGDF